MTEQEIPNYLRSAEKVPLRYFAYQVALDTSDLAAALLYDLQARISRQTKPLIKDKVAWTYDAMRVLVENHPYVSESGIRKALLALEADGHIRIEKTGKYNKKGYDKKWWYHVTPKGGHQARVRAIRYNPLVAASVGISEAVLIEHIRFKLHEQGAGRYIEIKTTQLGMPYSAKTISRNLKTLIARKIIEKHPENKNQYCLYGIEDEEEQQEEVSAWKKKTGAIIVSPIKLLPILSPGEIGLLAGHSGTGKTSITCFMAVQIALHGRKVLYVTLEEPMANIVARMYAGEYEAKYSEIHRGSSDAKNMIAVNMESKSVHSKTLSQNLQVLDLKNEKPQAKVLLQLIHEKEKEGFAPDVVIIDQLEHVSAPQLDPPEEKANSTEQLIINNPISAAREVAQCFKGQKFVTWVVSQVLGSFKAEFLIREIPGGEEVTKNFDCVVGIGRAKNDSPTLRLFPLSVGLEFEQVLDADFAYMRFLPKD